MAELTVGNRCRALLKTQVGDKSVEAECVFLQMEREHAYALVPSSLHASAAWKERLARATAAPGKLRHQRPAREPDWSGKAASRAASEPPPPEVVKSWFAWPWTVNGAAKWG